MEAIQSILTEIVNFILKYWAYLSLVGGTLVLILIISMISNARNKLPAKTIPEKSTFPPRPKILPSEPVNPPENQNAVEETNPSLPPIEPVLPESSQIEVSTTETPISEVVAEKENSPENVQDNLILKEEPLVVSETPEPLPVPKPKKVFGKYHVMYRADGKWIVKREGSPSILRVLETQREAISWATIKALSQDVGIVVHKKDGKIRKNNP